MTKYDEFFANQELINSLVQADLNPSDSAILDKVIEHYRDIKGESSNVKLIFLACISRRLPRQLRMHVADFSRSGAGKTHLLQTVSKAFKKDVVRLTGWTEAWLKHTMPDLEGKILFWQQVNKTDEEGKGTTGSLKIAISDDGIGFGYAIRDEQTGKWKGEMIQTEALPIVLMTTTRALNDEDMRRYFLLSNDESDKQTKDIINHKLHMAGSPKFQQNIKEGIEQLITLADFYEQIAKSLNIVGVLIPFAAKLEEKLPNNFAMRSDISKVIQLIQVIAFSHVTRRKCVQEQVIVSKLADQFGKVEQGIKNLTYIIAETEDADEAISIAKDIFTQTNYRIPKGSLELLKVVEGYQLVKLGAKMEPKDWPTYKQLVNDMKAPRSTIYSYVNPAKDTGFVDVFSIEGSKEKHIKLTDKVVQAFPEIHVDYTETEFNAWYESQFDGIAKLRGPIKEDEPSHV